MTLDLQPTAPAHSGHPEPTSDGDVSTGAGVRPTVAVVITCYDYAHFVGRAIDSVLAQMEPYAQVVVVDDGSTDESLAVIRAYEPRIEVVAKENSGLLGACLAGLERVRADYVHFLDADDVAAPELVQRCRPALASIPVKLQFQLAAVDEHGEPLGSVFPSFAPGYDSTAMRQDNEVVGFYQCPPTSGNLFRTDTLRQLGLEHEDPRLPLDGAGCAVMPYLGDVVTVEAPLAGYRVHGASMSNTQVTPTAEQCVREMREFETNWEVAARLLGRDAPPYGDATPLFLLEREHLRQALDGRSPSPRLLTTYLMRLRRSNLPGWQMVVQGVWMTSLLTPNRDLRTTLVHLRRSGGARPAWLRRLLALVRR